MTDQQQVFESEQLELFNKSNKVYIDMELKIPFREIQAVYLVSVSIWCLFLYARQHIMS